MIVIEEGGRSAKLVANFWTPLSVIAVMLVRVGRPRGRWSFLDVDVVRLISTFSLSTHISVCRVGM